jgi:O-methyltransferase
VTREWFDMVCADALGWGVDSEMTYDVAMLALQHGIPGDFVECGVFKGARSALMARALLDKYAWPEGWSNPETLWGRPHRRVHLFDSFEGMPSAQPIDAELYSVHQAKPGDASCSLEQVKANMQRWGIPDELLVYHPGWFEQTIPESAAASHLFNRIHGGGGGIAVLRLDGDLYSSTSVCMKHLFPLLSEGGYLIIDDYDLSGCRAAIHEHLNPAPIVWRRRP